MGVLVHVKVAFAIIARDHVWLDLDASGVRECGEEVEARVGALASRELSPVRATAPGLLRNRVGSVRGTLPTLLTTGALCVRVRTLPDGDE